jgi:hypothetical protein
MDSLKASTVVFNYFYTASQQKIKAHRQINGIQLHLTTVSVAGLLHLWGTARHYRAHVSRQLGD